MQPEDIVRVWNQEQARELRRQRHEDYKVVLVTCLVFGAIALLAWWVK